MVVIRYNLTPFASAVAVYVVRRPPVLRQVIAPGGGETICPPPADGSSTRGGSTSVRVRVRSPHVAKLRAASVPIAQGSCAMGQTDRRTDRRTGRGIA